MEFKVENGDGIDSWKEVTLVYSAALRQMETKMQILNDEFQHVHQYNPIEHIKARIKTPESIVKKLKRYGQESTIDNMVKYINDIAGIRIICSFTSDIYRIADMIRDQRDIKVIAVKDYITYPKASGYKSYHMIVSIPVYLSDRTVDTKVEVQIRTVAMDFWASLEHKIAYKFEGNAPENLLKELKACADMVDMLDAGLVGKLLDTQDFDLFAVNSVKRPNHHRISAGAYANPFNKGCFVNKLDYVVLAALEVDTHFNCNVVV